MHNTCAWSNGSVYGCSTLSASSKPKELSKGKSFEILARCSRLESRMLVETRGVSPPACPHTMLRSSSSLPYKHVPYSRNQAATVQYVLDGAFGTPAGRKCGCVASIAVQGIVGYQVLRLYKTVSIRYHEERNRHKRTRQG